MCLQACLQGSCKMFTYRQLTTSETGKISVQRTRVLPPMCPLFRDFTIFISNVQNTTRMMNDTVFHQFIKLMLYITILFIDLKAFIQFVTGCPVPVGNIAVTFTQHPEANTCGRQIVLSSLIQEDLFIPAMLAIIPGHHYTMP